MPQPMTPVRAIQIARTLLTKNEEAKREDKLFILTPEEELALETLIAVTSRVVAGFTLPRR